MRPNTFLYHQNMVLHDCSINKSEKNHGCHLHFADNNTTLTYFVVNTVATKIKQLV